MKAIIAGALLSAAVVGPALADFYIVQDSSTKRCTIVDQRPAAGGAVVVGTPFGARVEAETHMRTVEVCREGPGTSGRREGVTIQERR